MRQEDDDTNDLERRLRTYFRAEDRELEAPPGLWDRLSPRLGEQRRYGWAQRIGAIFLLRPLRSPESPPPWLNSIFRLRRGLPSAGGGIVKVVGILGTLAALGFGVAYTLNSGVGTFRGDPVFPQIDSITPSEVSSGHEIDVSGADLDLVEEVRLRKGLVVERLFMLPLGKTQMLLVVPSGVDPDEYILETRMQGKEEFISTEHRLAVVPPLTALHASAAGPKIVFANLNWDSARLQNAIARFIVEEGYEYQTDSIPEVPGNAVDVWESLLTGSVRVDMEVWLPNQREDWETALSNGSVIPLGKSLDLAWQSAFVVPTYVIEGNPSTGNAQAPGLRTVQDLRNYAEVFAKPGSNGKAVLWNCLAIWKCAKINEQQVNAYGLSDVIELRDPGSNEALFDKLRLAYETKEPWLGYMWGPTRVSSSMDLTRLEEPRCAVGQDPGDGCGYDSSRVRIAVHPSLIWDAPEVVELLRKWDFTASTQLVAEECLKEATKNFEKAAVCYLKAEEAVWTQWLAPEAIYKVREALNDS